MQHKTEVYGSCGEAPSREYLTYPGSVRHFHELVRSRQHTRSNTSGTGDQQDPGCPNCSGVLISRVPTCNPFGLVTEKRTLIEQRHNALQLSDEIADILKCRMRYATEDEVCASQEFRRLLEDTSRDGVMARLGRANALDLIHDEVEYVLDLLARSFFPGVLRFKFKFQAAKSTYLGSATVVDGIAHIEMHPSSFTALKPKFMPRRYNITEAAMGRLGTLLHEIVHAFIDLYACKDCPTYDRNVEDLNYHGLVWQRIACWVEYAAPRTIGLPLKLGRFEAIQANWNDFHHWPSPQELTEWSLVDEA